MPRPRLSIDTGRVEPTLTPRELPYIARGDRYKGPLKYTRVFVPNPEIPAMDPSLGYSRSFNFTLSDFDVQLLAKCEAVSNRLNRIAWWLMELLDAPPAGDRLGHAEAAVCRLKLILTTDLTMDVWAKTLHMYVRKRLMDLIAQTCLYLTVADRIIAEETPGDKKRTFTAMETR